MGPVSVFADLTAEKPLDVIRDKTLQVVAGGNVEQHVLADLKSGIQEALNNAGFDPNLRVRIFWDSPWVDVLVANRKNNHQLPVDARLSCLRANETMDSHGRGLAIIKGLRGYTVRFRPAGNMLVVRFRFQINDAV